MDKPTNFLVILLFGVLLNVVTGKALSNESSADTYHKTWPKLNSEIKQDPYIELRIKDIVSKMTLGEKVGQMIMPELKQITPEEAQYYKIGSILNGGGSWPNNNKYASSMDWVELADKYWLALDKAYSGRGFRIPFMWATDAVHGHNNVYGATIFPHNIGLGAANNPDLLHKIGEVTALEVAATGIDITFAPTVAIPRDYRWGRVYEGYSESSDITFDYSAAIVRGLQGDATGLRSHKKVLATVKHWIGDGGTYQGKDRGNNKYSEDYLRNIDAQGYYAALNAGAQLVMTSFNSWQSEDPEDVNLLNNNTFGKIHGSRYLIQEVLKGKMGFDGIVVTDWNGHGEIPGCTASNCPKAVNAGNDLFMVTDNKDWKGFYRNVIAQVQNGVITEERINDAVTRILRVKMRAGLWEKPRPLYRELAGEQLILGMDSNRRLARRAVRESLVLLKNSQSLLPLKVENQPYLVVGSAANDMRKQTGGWTLSWQGKDNKREDFAYGDTVLEAFYKQVGTKSVFTSIDQAPLDSSAVVVIGEDPYAEMHGDIKSHQTLAYSEQGSQQFDDFKKISKLKSQGFKVLTILLSGRPMYINPELDLSDAFVAAWLPGTEARGITDVLFSNQGYDFTEDLHFWPNKKCAAAINKPSEIIPDYIPPKFGAPYTDSNVLFSYGYGLNYSNGSKINDLTLLWILEIGDVVRIKLLPFQQKQWSSLVKLDTFFIPKMSGKMTNWKEHLLSTERVTQIGSAESSPLNYKHQHDALTIKFGNTFPMQFYIQTPDKKGIDMRDYLAAKSKLEFDISIRSAIPSSLKLASHCVYPCGAIAPISEFLEQVSNGDKGEWLTIRIPLECFANQGVNFSDVNTPLLIYADEAFSFDIGEIRYVPHQESEDDLNTMSCDLFEST